MCEPYTCLIDNRGGSILAVFPQKVMPTVAKARVSFSLEKSQEREVPNLEHFTLEAKEYEFLNIIEKRKYCVWIH